MQLAAEALPLEPMGRQEVMGQMLLIYDFVGAGAAVGLAARPQQEELGAMAAFLVVGEVRGLVAPQLEVLAAKGRTAG